VDVSSDQDSRSLQRFTSSFAHFLEFFSKNGIVEMARFSERDLEDLNVAR